MDRERAHAARASEPAAGLDLDGTGVDLLRAGRPLQLAHLLRRPFQGSPLHAPLPGERDRVPRTHRCGGPPLPRRAAPRLRTPAGLRQLHTRRTAAHRPDLRVPLQPLPCPVRDDLNTRLDEVQSAVAEIAGFTRQRQEELEQARERETALQVQAEKRRAINRSRTGFDPTPEDFSPRLTDRQLDLLTEHINRIGLFRRDVTRPEVELLLACQLPEPLQTTHNKLLALLLESLSAARFITPKWQRVAGAKGCFLSKLGKPLTAKDLSAAKQMADIIDAKHEQQILDCIRALEAAQS